MTPARFPHSDTPGSTLGCQLPRAYRRLLRPSSALDAKASTMCPSQLVTHTTNPTPTHKPGRRQIGDAHMTRHKEPPRPRGQSTPRAHTTTGRPEKNPGPPDARVHYPDLKQQPQLPPPATPHGCTGHEQGHRPPPEPSPAQGGPIEAPARTTPPATGATPERKLPGYGRGPGGRRV
jgi:hypothetical protein